MSLFFLNHFYMIYDWLWRAWPAQVKSLFFLKTEMKLSQLSQPQYTNSLYIESVLHFLLWNQLNEATWYRRFSSSVVFPTAILFILAEWRHFNPICKQILLQISRRWLLKCASSRTTGRTVGTLVSVWVRSSSLFHPRVRKYDNVRWVYHMGQLRKSGDLNWFIDWRLISLQEKKKTGTVRAEWFYPGGRNEEEKKWSKWLLRRQRPCCLGSDSTLYIRCPPPPPPSLPSELTIQFHPHERISSTAPSLIYSSIHLSLPPTNGKNNTQ